MNITKRFAVSLLTLIAISLTVSAQENLVKRWQHHNEIEYLVRHSHSTISTMCSLGYDDHARVAYRYISNLDCLDSLVYRYNSDDQVIYTADWRGNTPDDLFLYTYEEREYDGYIPSLCTWRVGWQNVDQEWTVYAAEKLRIDRDEYDQPIRVADYIPGDENIPDLPNTYVKTFTCHEGVVDSYTKEMYGMDPVTEEAFLRTDQKWTDMVWERYVGQVIDPNDCYSGGNRIKSAKVYDDYYGYEYDLSVEYGGDHPNNYVATMEIPSVSQRKVHTLTMIDENGSFVEEFSTYRKEEDGSYTLTFVENVTEMYDSHGNLELRERALTADREEPSITTVRQGTRYTYVYDDTYNDWTSRSQYEFYQSYEDGKDGTYEECVRVDRSNWREYMVDGVGCVVRQPQSADNRAYDLQGRRPVQRHGILVTQGMKVLY